MIGGLSSVKCGFRACFTRVFSYQNNSNSGFYNHSQRPITTGSELYRVPAYHYQMRYLLIALMIVLLPLRGWMGDAMATNMAINTAFGFENTPKTIAASAYKTSLSGQFGDKLSRQAAPASPLQAHSDCGEHVSGEAAPAAQAHDAPDEHDKLCHSCQACQACHTVALLSPLQAIKRGFAAPFMLPTAAAQYTSAYTALSQKPPIS